MFLRAISRLFYYLYDLHFWHKKSLSQIDLDPTSRAFDQDVIQGDEKTNSQNVAQRVDEIMRQVDASSALKTLAKDQGISKRQAYRELQRAKRER